MTITLVCVIILLFFSAFFSASETGFTAVIRAKIHKLKMEGNKRAIMVSSLRKDKDRLIGTILLGNNAVNIAASALATSFAINLIGKDNQESAVLIVTIVMTFLILIFAEVLPKSYAFRNADKVALTVAPVFMILTKILYPLTILVQLFVNVLMRIFRMKSIEGGSSQGIDLLRGAIDMHHQEGAMLKHDRDMLGGILDLAEMEVEEAMVHRNDMETINADEPEKKIIEKILAGKHSRIPVWKDNPENIIGILYSKDMVRMLQTRSAESIGKEDIMGLLKEPWFIPEVTTLKDQLEEFRRRQSHFALIIDEYGGLLGLITLEDILEEIVGQIEEEHEREPKKIKKQEDGSYLIHGNVSIRDLNRELDWRLPDEEAASLAGLVIYEAELIPDVGQVFNFHGYRFEIMKKKRNQITRIKVSKLN